MDEMTVRTWQMVRLVPALPGLAAAVVAYLVGADGFMVAASSLAYLGVLLPARAATLSLLAAPLLLAASLPLGSVFSLAALAPAMVAAAGAVPLFLFLGGGFPVRFVPLYVGSAALVLGAVWLFASPLVRLLLSASDVATRAQVLLVLVAVFVVDVILWLAGRLVHVKKTAPDSSGFEPEA